MGGASPFPEVSLIFAFVPGMHRRPPTSVPTPAAHLVAGYSPGLDIVTAADARLRQADCGAQSVAAACDAVPGCEFWSRRCGMDCQRLATLDACGESAGCSWSDATRHCYWELPACAAISSATHCSATALCAYNSSGAAGGGGACEAARGTCRDLGDPKP